MPCILEYVSPGLSQPESWKQFPQQVTQLASKSRTLPLLFMSRCLSVFGGCWITFLPDQKGWFHGYVSAPHLSGKIFKNVPLKGNREESWVEEDSERQHRLSTLRKLGEFWEVGCGIKSGMQRTMPREETTVRGPLIHHPWPCASHFSNCHMSKSFHPGTSGWKWRSCEGRTLIRQNVPLNHSKVGLRQFQT